GLWRVAEVLAQIGDVTEAQAMLDRTARAYPPTHTLGQAVWLPRVRAAIEIARGRADSAIDVLRSASSYDGADRALLTERASAYLAAGRAAEAQAEFRRAFARARYFRDRHMPIAQLGIARAAARAGDLAAAKTAYQDFLALWKDADP